MHQDSASEARGQQVITACAVINKVIEGEPSILVAKRAETKKFLPGKFELPGGHIDFGESPEDGLKRELKEELDYDVTIGGLFSAFTYVNEIKGSHSVELLYFAQPTDGSFPTVNSDDHSEILWVNKDSISIVEEVNGSEDQELPYLKHALRLLNGLESINFGSHSRD